MAMVCPQCNRSYQQRLQCPGCDVRLLYQASKRGQTGDDQRSQWQQSPWGRMVVGLLLAQGLYYGLRQLYTAGVLVTGDAAAHDVWSTLYHRHRETLQKIIT